MTKATSSIIEVNTNPVVFNNQNQINKLLGEGLQKAVKELKKSYFQNEDISLKTLFKDFFKLNKLPLIYLISREFEIMTDTNNIIYEEGSLIFEEDIYLGIVKSKNYVSNKYLRCGNKNCTQHYQATLLSQKMKICPKCKFKLKSKTLKSLSGDKQILQGLENPLSKKEIFDYLLHHKYLKLFNKKPSSKRLDFFDFLNDKIIVYDCKNKTQTFISDNDITQACWYVLVLRKYLEYLKDEKKINYYCNNLKIIKDGNFSHELNDYEKRVRFKNKIYAIHNIDLDVVDINDFITDNKTEKGFLNKVICEFKEEKKGKWRYVWSFIFNEFITKFTIKLIAIKKVKDYKPSGYKSPNILLEAVKEIEEYKESYSENVSHVDDHGFVIGIK